MTPRACCTAAVLAALGLPGVASAAEPAAPLPPRSTALAVAVEVVSPLGAAGCFYRRRTFPAILVAAGSLVGASILLFGLHQRDRDSAVIGAFTYAGMRIGGIAAAARPEAPVMPAPPAPKTAGFSYGFAF